MKKNRVLWFIALIIVNSGWYAVSQQSASQEINRPGADFSGAREAKIVALVGDSSDFEIEHCFTSINGAVHNASIRVELDSKVLYEWSGDTDDGCVTYSSESDEGTIVIFTEMEDGAESKTTLSTWPLKNALIPGMIIFSLGTLLVAYLETLVRVVIKKKIEKIDAMAIETTTEEVTPTNSIWQDPVRPN